MIRLGVVGLGKMGLSHLAIVSAHPEVDWSASATPPATCSTCSTSTPACRPSPTTRRCSTTRDARTRSSSRPRPTCTRAWCAPRSSAACTCSARSRFSSIRRRRRRAHPAGRANAASSRQVGYHNRFVASFAEVQRLLEAGAIGTSRTSSPRPTGPSCSSRPGRHLAQPRADRRRRASTTTPRTRSTCSLVPRRARVRSAAAMLTRSSRPRSTTRWRPRCTIPPARPSCRQLVRRVAAQDDHARSPSGARTAGSSPTVRSCRSTCATPRTSPTATGRAGTSATPPS